MLGRVNEKRGGFMDKPRLGFVTEGVDGSNVCARALLCSVRGDEEDHFRFWEVNVTLPPGFPKLSILLGESNSE